MPVTVIVGAQYGGEGKGKVSHHLAQTQNAKAVVRVGGTNSGHTAYKNGQKYILRQLPTAALLDDTICVLPIGSYIDLNILKEEIELTQLPKERLIIDKSAFIIDQADIDNEASSSLRKDVGSTLSGTGYSVMRRISRNPQNKLAYQIPELAEFITDTVSSMRRLLDKNARIIIEGTQGFGLSLFHTPKYPYCTSRDTTAASFTSECGLSVFDVDTVTLVARTFPIRVGGNSGPLDNEIDWKAVQNAANADCDIEEFTSVTKTLRRVANIDYDIINKAIAVNRPNMIVVNHMDYIDSNVYGQDYINETCKNFIDYFENRTQSTISHIGTSPYELFKK